MAENPIGGDVPPPLQEGQLVMLNIFG